MNTIITPALPPPARPADVGQQKDPAAMNTIIIPALLPHPAGLTGLDQQKSPQR